VNEKEEKVKEKIALMMCPHLPTFFFNLVSHSCPGVSQRPMLYEKKTTLSLCRLVSLTFSFILWDIELILFLFYICELNYVPKIR